MSGSQVEGDAVWYVAYGSNLNRTRLQRYLDRSPDPTPPTVWRPVTLPHRLFFAHESRVWGGGSAFLDPGHDPVTTTLATAWLLPLAQFLSVLAQENGRTRHPVDIDPTTMVPGQRLVVDDRRYGLVLGCESPDHRPAVTFTTPADPLPPANPPSEAYVETIVTGLVDGHSLHEHQARAYLTGRIH